MTLTTFDTSRPMRALVLHGPGDMRIENRPIPTPSADEVLVQVGSVGVCGSDRHFFLEGGASSDVIRQPSILGHEFGGTIVAVGSAIELGRVGERVSVEPLIPDWASIQARQGEYNIDPNQKFLGVGAPGYEGALQTYVAVPSANAYRVPDSVSDDEAALVEPLSVSLNGVRKAGVGLGSIVLVLGGGPIGLFAAQLCFLQGATAVALVEPNPDRRSAAEALGCHTFADLSEAGTSYDSAIECTGVSSVRHDCCLSVRPGGKVILIGVGAPDASVPMKAIIEREVSVQGVMRYRFTWPTVIDLLARKLIDVAPIISRRLPLDDAVQAWTNPLPTDVKVIIRPGE